MEVFSSSFWGSSTSRIVVATSGVPVSASSIDSAIGSFAHPALTLESKDGLLGSVSRIRNVKSRCVRRRHPIVPTSINGGMQNPIWPMQSHYLGSLPKLDLAQLGPVFTNHAYVVRLRRGRIHFELEIRLRARWLISPNCVCIRKRRRTPVFALNSTRHGA